MNPEIELSFRTAKTRLKILKFMSKYNTVYISQIARSLLLDNSNVKGCLEGNSRYNKNLSLVELKLVEIVDTTHRYYKISKYGKEVINEVVRSEFN